MAQQNEPNFIGGHASDGRKFGDPVFLEGMLNQMDKDMPKDGYLDPDKASEDINPDTNLEVLAEPKSISFNPFRRSMPRKQVSKKSEQKRKKSRRLQKQARRKNRK